MCSCHQLHPLSMQLVVVRVGLGVDLTGELSNGVEVVGIALAQRNRDRL